MKNYITKYIGLLLLHSIILTLTFIENQNKCVWVFHTLLKISLSVQ